MTDTTAVYGWHFSDGTIADQDKDQEIPARTPIVAGSVFQVSGRLREFMGIA